MNDKNDDKEFMKKWNIFFDYVSGFLLVFTIVCLVITVVIGSLGLCD